jgi:hypothetical protein
VLKMLLVLDLFILVFLYCFVELESVRGLLSKMGS